MMDEATRKAFEELGGMVEHFPYNAKKEAIDALAAAMATWDDAPKPTAGPSAPTPLPGFDATGFTYKTPTGTVKYEATQPTSGQRADAVKDNLQIGNNLASQIQIPELVPAKVRETVTLDDTGKPKTSKTTVPAQTIMRPATLSDVQNAQLVENFKTADPYGVPTIEETLAFQKTGQPLNSLQFGAGTTAIPLTPQFSDQYEQVLNSGRAMRGEPVLSPQMIASINDPVNVPALTADANAYFDAQQAARQFSLPAPAPNRNSALPASLYQDTAAQTRKALDRGLAVDFLRQAQGDKEKARQLARDAGFVW